MTFDETVPSGALSSPLQTLLSDFNDGRSLLVRPYGKSGLEPDFDDHNFSDLCDHANVRHFLCPECGVVHRVRFGCGSRFITVCPSCSRRWKRHTYYDYLFFIRTFKHPKFLTLTLRYDKANPSFIAQERDIWNLRKLLFRVLKDEYGIVITKWCGLIEYPNHLHLVIDSDYIDQELLTELWKEITTDSFIVDIRQVVMRDSSGLSRYLVKYISKADNWDANVPIDDLRFFHLKGKYCHPDLRDTVPHSPKKSLCCGVTLHLLDRSDFEWMVSHSGTHYEFDYSDQPPDT